MSNFFSQNKIRPWVLLSVFAIVALILWNTNVLFQILKEEERTKMELWATAQQELIENSDLSRRLWNLGVRCFTKNWSDTND